MQQAAGSSESKECERPGQRFASDSRDVEATGVRSGVPATAEIDRSVLKANVLKADKVSQCRIVVSNLFRGASSSLIFSACYVD